MADHQRFGYFMHPSRYDPPLGSAALDVYLAASQPSRFFDTEAALFSVCTGDKTIQMEILHPAAMAPVRYHVSFGRFLFLAHNGDMVVGMSFGGLLEIETHDTYTHCHLTSTAPIFDIEESGGLVATLETEIEAELARLRAEWVGSDAAFDCRLASIDPLTLFAACLGLLDDYLHNHLQAIPADEVLIERTAVRQAIRTLQRAGQWPQPVPNLRALMSSSGLPAAAQSQPSSPASVQAAPPRIEAPRFRQPARRARSTGPDKTPDSGI